MQHPETPTHYTALLHITLAEAVAECYDVQISTIHDHTYLGRIVDFDQAWVRINFFSCTQGTNQTKLFRRLIRLEDVIAVVLDVVVSDLSESFSIDTTEGDDNDNMVLA